MNFSHPLQPGVLTAAPNWFVRRDGTNRPVTDAVASGSRVVLETIAGLVDLGPDVVTFTPPPFDVISNTAVPTPAPAFADFPLI